MKRICKSLLTAVTLFVGVCLSIGVQAAYRLPDYQKLQLENGLTIYLMEQHEVPLVDVDLVVKVGAVQDGDKAGLSALTISNMRLGTTQQSKAEIDEVLDFIGAKVEEDGGLEFSDITASFAAKDQAKVLGLLRDMVISPRFEQQEFDKYKQHYLDQLRQQKERPSAVIGSYYNKLLFGDSGYGATVQGNEQTIKNITLDDVKAFHQSWYRPQNAAVVVAGDFDSKAMLIRLKALFSGWENKPLPAIAKPSAIPTFNQSRLLMVNKSDATETRFLIGGKGIARNNPDYVAVSVVNTILGGRFTSWLNDALRVNAGLTYGARSRFDSYSSAGTFAISSYTATVNTVKAIDLALSTYQKLFDKGIDEKTLASAKAYVKGQFPPRYETSAQLAQLMGAMFGYGFNESYINSFEQQVNSLTVDKVKQIVARYFPKDNLQFVLVGKADAIKDQVAKYGKLHQVEIKDVGFKVN